MIIYDNDKFNKYLNSPVRVKAMFPNQIAIADGAILASFKDLKELRQYFPYGNYRPLNN